MSKVKIPQVYVITNKINGKVYIGKTNDLERRWNEHKMDAKYSQFPIHVAMKKDGITNFIIEPIAYYSSKEEALQMEKFWTDEIRQILGSANVYNIASTSSKKKKSVHKKKTDELEQFIKDNFHYNSITGQLWRKYTNISQIAGFKSPAGYLRLKVLQTRIMAHHVIWFLFNGVWPKNQIDHINGIRDDNRIVNLREVNAKQNSYNKGISSHNTSGLKGVQLRKNGQFVSQIRYEGKLYTLGIFSSKEDAKMAYNVKANELFGEFARTDV